MTIRTHATRRHRRLAACSLLAGALFAGGATLAGTADATAARHARQPDHFDNALIARTALSYVGRWGGQACVDAHNDRSGQCKQFVNCVVAMASGGTVWPVDAHGDYQTGFAAAGGVPVGPADAGQGDIIQIGEHDTDPVLHTAIVLTNHHDGTFTVVDANWVGNPTTPELVGVHDFTPPAAARIWRLGTVSTTPPAKQRQTRPGPRASLPIAPSTPQPPRLGLAKSSPTTPGTSRTVTVAAALPDARNHGAVVRFWLDGRPSATQPVHGAIGTLRLDTAALAPGTHILAAQTITADGAISPLSATVPISIDGPVTADTTSGHP